MSVQVDPMAASVVAAALSGTYPTLLPQWCLPPREAPLVGVQTHQDSATAADQPLDLSAKPRNSQVSSNPPRSVAGEHVPALFKSRLRMFSFLCLIYCTHPNRVSFEHQSGSRLESLESNGRNGCAMSRLEIHRLRDVPRATSRFSFA